MAALNPYLNFNGTAEEAFNFYKSVFGGDFVMISRYKDSPPEFRGPESEGDKIMHVSLPIGKNNVLMGSDVPEHYGKAIAGTSVHISITADSKEEADKLFNGLSAGGNVMMPMSDSFWGAYFGMFADKFGIHWMVSFDAKNPK
jgi:PhnB protein